MVIPAAVVALLQHAPALAEAARPVEKLSPQVRFALLMALVGFALIGLFFVVAILLGGHWVRRQGTFRRGPSVPPDRAPLDLTKPGDATDNDDEPYEPSQH